MGYVQTEDNNKVVNKVVTVVNNKEANNNPATEEVINSRFRLETS
jgi:hypothetical protein